MVSQQLKQMARRLWPQQQIKQSWGAFSRVARIPFGRLKYVLPLRNRFIGAYGSREAALASIPSTLGSNYDDESVVNISYEAMCRVALWDYPVIFWLSRLLPEARRIIDAGGHMGTKYRAFQPYLDLGRDIAWTVYDLPTVVRVGRLRARQDGLDQLGFTDSLEGITADICLASGLLQYLDIPLSQLLGQLVRLPPHLLLNKVAWRNGPAVVTLENFGAARMPYQIRNRDEFLQEVAGLGYRILDEWPIPLLSHEISSHPELGRSLNSGFYLKLA